MPEIKVDSVVNLAGTGKPNFPVSPTHSGGSALSTLNTHSYTSSGTEPSSPKNGAIWWDSANSKVKVYINGEFKEITLNTAYPSSAWYGDRGLFFGGRTSSNNPDDQIEQINITSAGNATDFGNLTTKRKSLDGASDGSTGLMIAGEQDNYLGDGVDFTNTIDKVTTSTAANATDFGDTTANMRFIGANSNGSRCTYGGGAYNVSSKSNVIEYVTIATPGNGTDFGDLTETIEIPVFVGDATRGVRGGGQLPSSNSNVLDYWTMDTPGNATDFGDLTVARWAGNAGCSSAEGRGLFAGGYTGSFSNVIDYITISSTGNATDFGDLLAGAYNVSGTNNATIGVFFGGSGSSGSSNVIQKVTIATTGNATDFGDLSTGRYQGGALSGAAS
tara:strand:- start:2738 stop:3901 length:1164 start_codon:yes stop_codon:yes gene_type:complete